MKYRKKKKIKKGENKSKKRQEELLLELGKPLKLMSFSGGHELDSLTLEKIINKGF